MNSQSAFLLFWSLSSGFGIIFAISSWVYDIYGIKQDPFFPGSKGVLSLVLGFILGLIHYQLSTQCITMQHDDKNDNDATKYAKIPQQTSDVCHNHHLQLPFDIEVVESELQSINLQIDTDNPTENGINDSFESSTNSNANTIHSAELTDIEI